MEYGAVQKFRRFTSLEAESLRWFGRRRSRAIDVVLDERSLEGFRRPWIDYAEALRQAFGIVTDSHCFSTEPHAWAQFHEPQITKGLAYFLQTGGSKARMNRARACLAALGVEGVEAGASPIVETHAVAEASRIDLSIVSVTKDGRKIGAIIEAKFGHKITPGQLSKNKKASSALGDAVTRYVVAPYSTKLIRKHMRANSSWKFLTWRSFLTRLETRLPHEVDDDDFRIFRRTIWYRAYDL